MIKYGNIIIKNIYYMLSYAYQDLQKQKYKDLDIEKFDNGTDLLTAILIKGLSEQIKRGLYQNYQERRENLSVIRGKIDVTTTINKNFVGYNKAICCFDELTSDNIFNRIIKTTLVLLLRTENINRNSKLLLKKYLYYFREVKLIDLSMIKWENLRNLYVRNNISYRMMINICYLIYKNCILTNEYGQYRFMDFVDSQAISHLYEKFVLNYYRTHYKSLNAKSEYISWVVDEGYDVLLPNMKTDISLSYKDKILIIDTKFYQNILSKNRDYSAKYHSSNLYQIFTYVKNKDMNCTGKVMGLLLYAKTNQDFIINSDYMMNGNRIIVKTLDLSKDFAHIKQQLNEIADILIQQ